MLHSDCGRNSGEALVLHLIFVSDQCHGSYRLSTEKGRKATEKGQAYLLLWLQTSLAVENVLLAPLDSLNSESFGDLQACKPPQSRDTYLGFVVEIRCLIINDIVLDCTFHNS